MALVDVAQRLLDSIETIRFCRLVVPRPIHMYPTNINIGNAIDDPILDFLVLKLRYRFGS